MRPDEQYLVLLQKYPEHTAEDGISTSVGELADLFGCTHQNAKLIIKKMLAYPWIAWIPGNGRGHKSRLFLLRPRHEHVYAMSENLLDKGRIKEAFHLMKTAGQGPESAEQWNVLLRSYLGFSRTTIGPKSEHKLRIPFFRPINSLDPIQISMRTESHLVRQVFDTLLTFNREANTITPQLALHWERYENGTRWVFYLRRHVLFHHGKELTAQDVVYSLQRIRNRLPYWGSIFQNISACGTYALDIRLHQAEPLLLNFLCDPRASIVPQDIGESRKRREQSLPLGTGPFQVAEHRDDQLVLEAFPNYFQGRVQLDRVEIWIPPGTDALWDYLAQPGAQGTTYWPVKARTNAPPDYRVMKRMENGGVYLAFNETKGGCSLSLDFRKAISLLLDPHALTDHLGREYFAPSSGFLHHARLPAQSSIRSDEIKNLLRGSGYQGQPIQLHTYQVMRNDFERTAEWIKDRCAEVGMTVEIVVHPFEPFHKNKEQADLLLFGIVMSDDLDLFLHEYLHGELGQQTLPLTDEAKAHLRRMMDKLKEDEGTCRVRALEEELRREFHVVFLYHNVTTTVHHNHLCGVHLTSDGWLDFRTLWEKEDVSETGEA